MFLKTVFKPKRLFSTEPLGIAGFDKRLLFKKHNISYYDKYHEIYLDKYIFDKALQESKDNWEEFKKTFNHSLFEKMQDTTANRVDNRSSEEPERIENFLYYTKMKVWNGTTITNVYRSNLDGSNELLIFSPQYDKVIPQNNLETANIINFVVSDDQTKIAVLIDLRNTEMPTCFIKDLKTNQILRDQIENCYVPVFSKCNRYIYFIQKDKNFRPCRLMRHKIGDVYWEETKEVYFASDERVYLNVHISKDKKWYILSSVTKNGSTIRVAPRNEKPFVSPQDDMKWVMIAGENDKVTICDHFDGEFNGFFIGSSANLENAKNKGWGLYFLSDKDQGVSNLSLSQRKKIWNIISLESQEFLNEIDIFEDKIVLYSTIITKSSVKVYDMQKLFNLAKAKYSLKGNMIQDKLRIEAWKNEVEVLTKKASPEQIDFKQNSHLKSQEYTSSIFGTVYPGVNMNKKQKMIRFHFDSWDTYNEVYELDIESNMCHLIQDFKLSGENFDRKKFDVKLIYAPSHDGEDIPITIIYPKRIIYSNSKAPHNPQKLLIKNYGVYGLNNELTFSISEWSLQEHGWVIAYAHIRGGSELGSEWYSEALKEKKINSVKDLISCAEYLCATGWTHPSLLAAKASSAGATILAAAMNFRPYLFRAVNLQAPFLDVRSSQVDESQPLTVSDKDEFGDIVNDPMMFDHVTSYCPYVNLSANHSYPAILINAYKKDHRTPLWGILKYVKKFREITKKSNTVEEFCDKNIVLYLNEGGHLGSGSENVDMQENIMTNAFFEWIIEEKSMDLKSKENYVNFKSNL